MLPAPCSLTPAPCSLPSVGAEAVLVLGPQQRRDDGHHGPGAGRPRQDPRLQLHPVEGAAEDQVARQVRRGAEGQRQVGSTGPEADQGDLQPVPGAAQPAGAARPEGAGRGLQVTGLRVG